MPFFPLEAPPGAPTPGSAAALLGERFAAYQRHVRANFFDTHFASFDRQVMLVDVLGALYAGRAAFEDTAQYRQRWGLPADYPMLAPSYASHRSSLAKQSGLGRRPGSAAPEQANPAEKSEKPDLPAELPVTQGRARRARGSKG